MTHFHPTERFLDYVEHNYSDCLLVDAGCGEGWLSFKLRGRHLRCLAIDPLPSSLTNVLPMKIHNCNLIREKPTVIIAARPDHGGWVGEIPRYMHADSVLLYVGLRKNVKVDLWELKRKVVLRNAGQDGEWVWLLRKQNARSEHEDMARMLDVSAR